MSIAMYPSELHIGGTLVSNEMESGDHSLLLSLPAQAKLGLIKDMRIGKGTLREYPDQELKLARVRSTGLLALCISDFVKEQFNEVLKDFHKSSKGMKQSLTDSDVEKWSNKVQSIRCEGSQTRDTRPPTPPGVSVATKKIRGKCLTIITPKTSKSATPAPESARQYTSC